MTTQDLIEGLNTDLSAEFGTVIRYVYQAGKCCGLLTADLRSLLLKEAQDELGHAAFLTDVIQDLGGEPTTASKPFDKPSDLKQMLELNVRLEGEDVSHYLEHAEIARQLRLPDLAVSCTQARGDRRGRSNTWSRVTPPPQRPVVARCAPNPTSPPPASRSPRAWIGRRGPGPGGRPIPEFLRLTTSLCKPSSLRVSRR